MPDKRTWLNHRLDIAVLRAGVGAEVDFALRASAHLLLNLVRKVFEQHFCAAKLKLPVSCNDDIDGVFL